MPDFFNIFVGELAHTPKGYDHAKVLSISFSD